MGLLSHDRFNQILSGFNEAGSILVIGDVGIDKYTVGNVKRISPEAPVPVIEVVEENVKLGMAANISNNLNSLGIDSTLCGPIGTDNNGILFKTILREEGLTLEGIVETPTRFTTYKERITTNVQQICRVDYESRDLIDQKLEDQIYSNVEQLIDSHGAIILEDYGKGLFTQRLTYNLIELVNKKNKILTVDPSRITPPEFYKNAMLLKPNRDEAYAMARSLGGRSDDIEYVANTLVEKLSLKMVVITLGADGMAILDTHGDGKVKTIPSMAREVYDVSGAGDTSIGVITTSLLAGGTLEESVWMGNCACGVVIGKMGTATSSRQELSSFYKRILKENS